jgi:microsomal dipeptidase-like Zn-dependent dipeptidase
VEGNVALQAFTVVTKVPRGINIERNDDRGDTIFWLGLAERWPMASWTSLRERALYQARRLAGFAAASSGRVTLIRTRADLDAYLERRTREPGRTAGFLGIEGAHALDGDLENLGVLFDAGFRMIAPTHFFDNDIGGSAHGAVRGGLTPKGREMIGRMERMGILLDLAHASEQTFADAIALSTRPVVVSHTGVRATCDNRRNLSDDQLRAVGGTGGLVGIGYWETAVCGSDAAAIARAVVHAVRVAGPGHVGLGSDFDGAVTTPFDTSGLAQVTQALLDAGLDDEQIAAVMGGNALRVLRATLP